MRVVDTRVFHRFDSGRVIRQTTVKEASFAVLGEAMVRSGEGDDCLMQPHHAHVLSCTCFRVEV